MAFDREAAKAAGYSDDEINAYMQAEAEKQKTEAPAPVVADVGEPPAPTTTVKPIESTAASVTTTGAMAAAPYVVPALGAAGAALGGKALYNRWDQSAKAAQALADAKLASEQGIAQRFEQRMAQQAGQAAGQAARPVAPTQLLDQFGRPMSTGPVAPATPAAPAAAAPTPAQAQPSLLDKTTNMIRQLAANRVFNGLAKGGIGLAAAVTPGNVGQNYPFPQTGRMRGMEINPLTGRPWTPEQLAMYNANPAQFDSQLPPAQMPR